MKRNILVAHGGGPTTVINASLFGVIDEAMRQSSSGKVFGAIHGVEGVLNDELIELSSQDQKQAFAASLYTCFCYWLLPTEAN